MDESLARFTIKRPESVAPETASPFPSLEQSQDKRDTDYELLEKIYSDLEVGAFAEALNKTLGSGYVISDNYPLVSTISPFWSNWPDRPKGHVPGVLRIGSKLSQVERREPIEGTNITGITGQIVSFRSLINEDVPSKISGRSFDDDGNLYHDALFFCLVIGERRKDGLVVPYLAYGDMDHASWEKPRLKAGLEYVLNNEDWHIKFQQTERPHYFDPFLKQVLLGGRSSWHGRKLAGVLSQSKTYYVDAPMEIVRLQEDIHSAMQSFVDRLTPAIDQVPAKPEQYAIGRNLKPVTLARLGQSALSPVIMDKKYNWHIRNWADLVHDNESEAQPFVRAVGDACSRTYTKLLNKDGLGTLKISSSMQDALLVLMGKIPVEDLSATYRREKLTDEEIRRAHACFPRLAPQIVNLELEPQISIFWKEFLERFPYLYPDLTPAKLLAASAKS